MTGPRLFAAMSDDIGPDELILCARSKHDRDALFRARDELTVPRRAIELTLLSGTLADFCMSDVLVPVVSAGMRNLLAARSLTGWVTFPVLIHERSRVIAGFEALVITGMCGALRENKSAAELVEIIPGVWARVARGLNLDLAARDGSDFSRPLGTLMTLASERAKIAIEDAGLSGIRFTAVEAAPDWRTLEGS